MNININLLLVDNCSPDPQPVKIKREDTDINYHSPDKYQFDHKHEQRDKMGKIMILQVVPPLDCYTCMDIIAWPVYMCMQEEYLQRG